MRQQPRLRRSAVQHHVKRPVQRAKLLPACPLGLLLDRLGPIDPRVRNFRHRAADRQAFRNQPHVEYLDKICPVGRCYPGTAVRFDGNKPQRFELPDSLTNRHPAHPESAGQVILSQWRIRRHYPRDDLVAQRVDYYRSR